MSEDIAFKYLPEKNPKGRVLTGVPLTDLTTDQYNALPRWVQQSVAACGFYEAVAPTAVKTSAQLAADLEEAVKPARKKGGSSE